MEPGRRAGEQVERRKEEGTSWIDRKELIERSGVD